MDTVDTTARGPLTPSPRLRLMPPLPLSLDTDTTVTMLTGGYPLELSLDNVYWIQYTDSLTEGPQ